MSAGPTFFESLSVFLGLSEHPGAAELAHDSPAQQASIPRPPPPPLTPQDAMVKEMTTSINHATRDFTRELNKMKRGEDKKIRDIRMAGERNDTAAALRIARSMVSTYRAQRRLEAAVAKMEGMRERVQSMRATATVARCFKQTLNIMTAMNKFMVPDRIKELATQMAKESGKFELTQQSMDVAMGELEEADADDSDDETLSDQIIVEQIMAMSGLAMADALPQVPTTAAPAPLAVKQPQSPPQQEAEKLGPSDEELETRMRALKARK